MKKSKQKIIPTIKQFTDEEGKKWIQTSTNDFLSLKELNDILDSIENDKDPGEVIFAQIEFYKVNKEYHDLAVSLQDKLIKQTELLKKVINESKKIIDKKNDKLKELIAYIRKLHNYFEYIKSNEKEPGFMVPSEIKEHDWKSDHLISNLKDFSEKEHESMKKQKDMENKITENNHEENSIQEDTKSMDTNKRNDLNESSDLQDMKLSDIDTTDGEEFEMMMLEDVEIFMSDVNETTKSSQNSENLQGQAEKKETSEDELILESNNK